MLLFGKNVDIKGSPESKEMQDTSLLSGLKGFFSKKIRSFVDNTMEASPIVQGLKTVRTKLVQREDSHRVVRTSPMQEEMESPVLTPEEQVQADMLMEAGLAEYDRIEAEATAFLHDQENTTEAVQDLPMQREVYDEVLVTDAEIRALYPDFSEDELVIAKRTLEEARRNIREEESEVASVQESTHSYDAYELDDTDWEAAFAEIDAEEAERAEAQTQMKKTARSALNITPKVQLETSVMREAERSREAAELEARQREEQMERKAAEKKRRAEKEASKLAEALEIYGEKGRQLEEMVNSRWTKLSDIPALVAQYADVPLENVLVDFLQRPLTVNELIHFHTRFEDTQIRMDHFAKHYRHTQAHSMPDENGKYAPSTVVPMDARRHNTTETVQDGEGDIVDFIPAKSRLKSLHKAELLDIIDRRVQEIPNTIENRWHIVGGYLTNIHIMPDAYQRLVLEHLTGQYISLGEVKLDVDVTELINDLKGNKPTTEKKSPKKTKQDSTTDPNIVG